MMINTYSFQGVNGAYSELVGTELFPEAESISYSLLSNKKPSSAIKMSVINS